MGFIDGLQVMFGTKDAAPNAKEYANALRQEAVQNRVAQMKNENKEMKKRLDDLEEQMIRSEEPVISHTTLEQPSAREDIDQLIVGVTIQIQEMIDSLDKKMEELDQRVAVQVRRIGESSEKQLAAFRLATEQMDHVQETVAQIPEMKTSTDQITSIAANTEQISSIKESTDQINEIRSSLLQLGETITSLRTDLSEKIHTEDVKCYRNIKGLVDELGVKMETVEIADASLNKIKNQNKAMKVFASFAVIDCALMVLYFLYTLGIIAF